MNVEEKGRYLIETKGIYDVPYSDTYLDRTERLGAMVEEVARKRCSMEKEVFPPGPSGREVLLIGCLVIQSRKKPTIIGRLGSVRSLEKEAGGAEEGYYSKDNEYFIENKDLGRMRLEAPEGHSRFYLVNGSVIGVVGIVGDTGVRITSLLFPESPSRLERGQGGDGGDKHDAHKRGSKKAKESKHAVLLVSGAMVGEAGGKRGAGKSLYAMLQSLLKNQDKLGLGSLKGAVFLEDSISTASKGRSAFGEIAGMLSDSQGEVVVVPGRKDVVPRMLPLQPIHPSCFGARGDLALATNPSLLKLGNKRVLLCPSDAVIDLAKYSPRYRGLPHVKVDEWLDALEIMLALRHMAPTSPDTLEAYPMKSDLFVIEDVPDVLVAGNLGDEFGERTLALGGRLVRLLVVPRFCSTHSGVVLGQEGDVTLIDTAYLE